MELGLDVLEISDNEYYVFIEDNKYIVEAMDKEALVIKYENYKLNFMNIADYLRSENRCIEVPF